MQTCRHSSILLLDIYLSNLTHILNNNFILNKKYYEDLNSICWSAFTNLKTWQNQPTNHPSIQPPNRSAINPSASWVDWLPGRDFSCITPAQSWIQYISVISDYILAESNQVKLKLSNIIPTSHSYLAKILTIPHYYLTRIFSIA